MKQANLQVSLSDADDQPKGLADLVEKHLQKYFRAHRGNFVGSGLYKLVMQEVETPLIRLALEQVQGNQLKASEILGINRNTLRKKIKELKICIEKE